MNRLWYSIHFYRYKDADKFLREEITEIISYLQYNDLITKFFFIRYHDGLPHIRLRLKLKSELYHSRVKEYLKSFCTEGDFDNSSKGLYLKEITYTPEIVRYGGLSTIEFAEDLFCLSSKSVLKIIKENTKLEYSSKIGYSYQMNLIFALSVFDNPNEIKDLFQFLCDLWLNKAVEQSNQHLSQVRESFDIQLKSNRSILSDFVSQTIVRLKKEDLSEMPIWMADWTNNLRMLFSENAKQRLEEEIKVPAGFKNNKLWFIFDGLVHMTNNRLGVANMDEPYIYHLIANTIIPAYYD